MNTIRPFFSLLIQRPSSRPPAHGFKSIPVSRYFIGQQSTGGSLRYGCVNVIDYTGDAYLIPYTCAIYTDEIDGLIRNIVCDIPQADYHVTAHIIESMVNQQLFRAQGKFYNVKLMPPAKNMLPPCHNLS
jgi:hypothetical protein